MKNNSAERKDRGVMSDKKINRLLRKPFLRWQMRWKQGSMAKSRSSASPQEGSEHGEDNIAEAMELAEAKGLKAVLIEGEDIHKKMEEMLDSGEIDGAVTMHYPFPIGVSTVGKVVTPGNGKPMYHCHHHRHVRHRPCLRHG